MARAEPADARWAWATEPVRLGNAPGSTRRRALGRSAVDALLVLVTAAAVVAALRSRDPDPAFWLRRLESAAGAAAGLGRARSAAAQAWLSGDGAWLAVVFGVLVTVLTVGLFVRTARPPRPRRARGVLDATSVAALDGEPVPGVDRAATATTAEPAAGVLGRLLARSARQRSVGGEGAVPTGGGPRSPAVDRPRLLVASAAALVALGVLLVGDTGAPAVALATTTLLAWVITAGARVRGGRAAPAGPVEAETDELTGLPNRRRLLHDAAVHLGELPVTGPARVLAAGRSAGVPGAGEPRRLGLLLLDLDGFKTVNDSLGHHVGDDLLRRVATVLQRTLAGRGALHRLGGDEFVVLLPETGPDQALAVAQELVAALEPPVMLAGIRVRAGASIGVVAAPEHGGRAVDLLRRADSAMYRAKAVTAAPRVVLADRSESSETLLRHAAELDRTLASRPGAGRLMLSYSAITAARAAVSWQHPAGGGLRAGGEAWAYDATLSWRSPGGEVLTGARLDAVAQAAQARTRLTDAALALVATEHAARRHRSGVAATVEDELEEELGEELEAVLGGRPGEVSGGVSRERAGVGLGDESPAVEPSIGDEAGGDEAGGDEGVDRDGEPVSTARGDEASPQRPCAPVAVRLSLSDLRDARLPDRLGAVVEAAAVRAAAPGLSPACFAVLVEEDSVMASAPVSVPSLAALRRKGFHVHLDRFGRGRSSLSRLRELPLGVVRLDPSLLTAAGLGRDVGDGPDEMDVPGRRFLAATAELVHSLGMRIVACGVHQPSDVALVGRLGYDGVVAQSSRGTADSSGVVRDFDESRHNGSSRTSN